MITILLTAAALLTASTAEQGARLQAAGRVVARDTTITLHCATPAQDGALRADYAYAETTVASGDVVISSPVCRLALYGGADRRRSWAVEIIAHELGHATLHTHSECRAEAYGMAHWQTLARTLHLPPATAAQSAYLAHQHFIFPACG